jgi:hypothetical protein
VNRSRVLLLPLAAVVASCGGPVLFAELEAPSICATLPDYAFTGTSGSSLQTSVAYDMSTVLPAVSTNANVEYELRLQEVETTLVTAPGYDFGAIESFRVVALATATLPEVELVSYVRDPAAPATSQLVARGAMNVDLGPYLDGGLLDLRLEYTGGLPAADWTANVRGCFYLKATLDYGKLLPL